MILCIIMAIAIISLGFLSRSDIELASGSNMLRRVQMDQMADSALEHARGLLLNPQEVSSTYWTGDTYQQLIGGSSEYYDVTVARDVSDPYDYCTYSIDCEAYRLVSGEKVARSGLSTELRFDPSIALWTGAQTTLGQRFALFGDLYCAGSVTSLGMMRGDAFCEALSGTFTGRQNAAAELALAWPEATVVDFSTRYATLPLSGGTLSDFTFGPSTPVRVVYRAGDLTLNGNVSIDGMLLVDGDLAIRGAGIKIVGAKNLPALYVTGDMTVGAVERVTVQGLAVVDGTVTVSAAATKVQITGALFAGGALRESAPDSAGGNHEGSIYGAPAWQAAGGALNGALELDGTGDYLRTADDNGLQLPGDYTLSVWIKPNATQSAWAGVVGKTNSDDSMNHWTLQFNDASPLHLVVKHPTETWDTSIALTELNDTLWHHVAVVHEAAGLTAYLDGVVKNTSDPNHPIAAPGTGVGHLNIGLDRIAGPASTFGGLIDDVRVYNSALTEAAVQQLHAKLAGAPLPIGHWKLDEMGAQITIIAEPVTSAIVVWPSGTREHWMPAADAFFRSRVRQ
ncbi:MAG: hypothetical protein JW741_09185 [Sedimentisphaerales bacterium]|nr:hypothetical protein [Sedimentisphaerales bacterium]